MENFGEELRKEREARNISLEEISKATKIHIKFLKAIEENNFDILPGEFFIRNFLKAYANYIGLDEKEILNRYYQYRPKISYEKEEKKTKRNLSFYLKTGFIILAILFLFYLLLRVLF